MNYEIAAPATVPLYARFPRRLRGIFIDWVFIIAVAFGGLFIAIAINNDKFSQVLGFAIVVAFLLYEPVLVSYTGGTLGHYFANLKVVDDHSQGNISFLKAVARVVTKFLFGWYSFIVILATRRNQAMHDLLTRSTVQIRDPAKASPYQYITERTDSQGADMPSRWRRIAVICVYLLLELVVLGAVATVVLGIGGMLQRCLIPGFCWKNEPVLTFILSVTPLALSIAWLVVMAMTIGMGWRGRLFGARKKSSPAG